jgi:hypothetical protein
MYASNAAATGAGGAARVPFRFPFHPPATALPLQPANFLTPHWWRGADGSSAAGAAAAGLGTAVRIIAGLLALGAIGLLYRAPKPSRKIRQADLLQPEPDAADAAAAASSSERQGRHVHNLTALTQSRNNSSTAASGSGDVVPRVASPPAVSSSSAAAAASSSASKAPAPSDAAIAAIAEAARKAALLASAPVPATPARGSAAASAIHEDDEEEDHSLAEGDESTIAATDESASASAADESMVAPLDPRFTTPRRSTLGQSHIDSIAKRERKSATRRSVVTPAGRGSIIGAAGGSPLGVYASPSKIAAAERGEIEVSDEPLRPLGVRPFALGIITPRSLARYGALLKQGFEEFMTRQNNALEAEAAAAAAPGAASSASPSQALLRSVEVCMPESNETAAQFSARMRATKRFDVLLIQYHGSEAEQPIAFVEHSDSEEVPRILLLHRPEEILLRHAQHVYKAEQYNVIKLLREVDVVVLLGETARPAILRALGSGDGAGASAATPANVCVVPHGFSDLLSAEEQHRSRPLAPIAVVGSDTTWSDMRWVADLIQLRQELDKKQTDHIAAIAARKRTSAGGKHKSATKIPSAHNVLFYASGVFSSYIHPLTKEPIDEVKRLLAVCPEQIAVVTPEQLNDAPNITDAASLKKHLWALSNQGARVVVCRGSGSAGSELSPRLRALHADLFDFNVQLYREMLRDYAPKVEYSGTLHARPGASIPVVFDSPAMQEVEVEGLRILSAAYHADTPSDDIEAVAASAAAAAAAAPASSDSANSTTPWYPKASYAPDFARTVEGLLRFLERPATFQAQRAAAANDAAVLSMRHVASQYANIIERLCASNSSPDASFQ